MQLNSAKRVLLIRLSLMTMVVLVALLIGREFSTTARTATFVTRDPNEILTKLKTKFNSAFTDAV